MKIIAFFVLCALARVTTAAYGVDVSDIVYISGFQCLNTEGFNFVIVRCWQSTGSADPNCPHTIYNAWDGGMSDVDIYMFPCFSCGNAAGQVQQLVNYVNSYNCKYGMLWFDIENPQYWGSVNDNVQFMQELLDEANALGQKIGIYTSASQWNPIMGGSTIGSAYPLWYADWDGSGSFSDFSPFGGWSSPAMKQSAGDTSVCGYDVDEDWYP